MKKNFPNPHPKSPFPFPKSQNQISNPKIKKWIINSVIKKYDKIINNTMESVRKLRGKKKIEVKHLISCKIMDIVKKFENEIQIKPTSLDDKGKNREISMVDEDFRIL